MQRRWGRQSSGWPCSACLRPGVRSQISQPACGAGGWWVPLAGGLAEEIGVPMDTFGGRRVARQPGTDLSPQFTTSLKEIEDSIILTG